MLKHGRNDPSCLPFFLSLFLWNLVWCFRYLDLLCNLPEMILTLLSTVGNMESFPAMVCLKMTDSFNTNVMVNRKLHQALKLPWYISTPKIIQVPLLQKGIPYLARNR